MRGSEILKTIPASGNPLPAIWNAVKSGYLVPPVFRPLTLMSGDHMIEVWVATDALHLGEPGDSFRPMASALLSQMVADLLGLYLPTARVVRAAYQASEVKVSPKTQPAGTSDRVAQGYSPSMMDRAAMERHNREVDIGAGLSPGAAAPSEKRIYSSGKTWINDLKLATHRGQGCNHGWYSTSAPYADAKGVKLWQDRGISHHNAGTDLTTNPGHYDYSQTLSEMVYPWVRVDGKQWMDWAAVLRDPKLSPAVNDDGVLSTARPYVQGTPNPLPKLPLPTELVSGSQGGVSYMAVILASLVVVGGVFALAHFSR